MQDDFTDDVASGRCLQLGGMSVGRRREGRDIAIGSARNNLFFFPLTQGTGAESFCRAQHRDQFDSIVEQREQALPIFLAPPTSVHLQITTKT